MGPAVLIEISVFTGLGLGLASGCCWYYYIRRAHLYRRLAERRPHLVRETVALDGAIPATAAPAEAFRQHPLIRCESFLPPALFLQLQEEVRANAERAERRSIPLHKKGATLSYEALHRHAPACLSVYHSPALWRWLSEVVGQEVRPVADHDQSACSLLYYSEPGDHIAWHYDHNFYKGRHFTALLSLVNRSATGTVSASRLQSKNGAGEVRDVDTSENVLVLFEGARVLHRVTPTEPGDVRIVLSMTFATDPRVGWLAEVPRRIKDVAYFGLRALWD